MEVLGKYRDVWKHIVFCHTFSGKLSLRLVCKWIKHHVDLEFRGMTQDCLEDTEFRGIRKSTWINMKKDDKTNRLDTLKAIFPMRKWFAVRLIDEADTNGKLYISCLEPRRFLSVKLIRQDGNNSVIEVSAKAMRQYAKFNLEAKRIMNRSLIKGDLPDHVIWMTSNRFHASIKGLKPNESVILRVFEPREVTPYIVPMYSHHHVMSPKDVYEEGAY